MPEAIDHVALIRAVYERFRGDDLEGALELLDPEIEVRERPVTPDTQVRYGHDGVREALRDNRSTFQDLDMVPEEFIDAGDRVIVVFRFQGTGRGSGVPVDERLAHVWTIRRGKAIRMEVYSGRGEALRAAGA